MKRKNEKVPEFDEIIFENRNKSYGAYALRKKYKSTASLSILGAITFSALIITALSLTQEESKASSGPADDVIFVLSKPVDQLVVNPPEIKPPDAIVKAISNLQPKVVTDSLEATDFIPITDVITATVQNGNVTDTVTYAEPITPEIPVESTIFYVVEEPPDFPGGMSALYKVIGENLVYPTEAQNLNIQGRVILKFVVNPDGSTDKIEVLKGIDPMLDNEAVRVVKTLPKFKPGKQGGVPVRVWFTLPVLFKIENN
jgi:protein TonB